MTTGSDTPATKAAIVTGSATGIGAAVARELASRGWGVVINYTRSEREAVETVDACRAAGAARRYSAAATSRSTRPASASSRPHSKRSGAWMRS